jgi:hypothetical protein
MNDMAPETTRTDDIPTHDVNVFLHELRTRAIRRMPPGARVFLSGGCSGAWYFDWIRQNYPGTIARHVGLEYYHPRPAQLPAEVEWVCNTLARMDGVATHAVDLVFAGQTVEHIWPEDMMGFLCESHRVLRPGGWIVLDSPNRRITGAIGWHQPEHTIEYNVDEIVELLGLAGFTDVRVRGLWLCYDRELHRTLPFDPSVPVPGLDYKQRVVLADPNPEDSFIWWAEARRDDRPPDRERLLARCQDVYDAGWPGVVGRTFHAAGTVAGSGRNRLVRTAAGEGGYLKYGPYVPLRPGRYQVTFAVGSPVELSNVAPEEPVGEVDVISTGATKIHARRPIAAGELRGGRLVEFPLPFELAETAFGIEFRIVSTGRVPLFARYQPDFLELTPEVESLGRPHEQCYLTATDLIWKELDVLQTRYNLLGTLISQLHDR